MKSLLEFILIHLVNNPDAVSVEEIEEGDSMVYVLHVAPDDMGRIIGKSGKIINSIRTIAKVRAVKEQRHVLIRVGEQDEPVASAPTEEIASKEVTE